MKHIVFVGSNPSNASETEEAFARGTKSYKILESWAEAAAMTAWAVVNVSNKKTPNNRPLNTAEIKEAIPDLINVLKGSDKVVALGKTAAKALTMAGIFHLEMPHPSGLNRKLNDPDYVFMCLNNLRRFVHEE